MKNPIFIIGCPRSGTTILSKLLSKTCYGEPFETHYITKYYKRLKDYGDLDKFNNFKQLVTHILNERPIMQWELGIDIEKIFSNMTSHSYTNIINEIGMQIARKQNKHNWGDKTPHYLIDLDIINELFPKSKFIYIVRDGRDVALSLLERPWPPYNIYFCAQNWKIMNSPNHTLDVLESQKQLYKIKYEDLLDNPEIVVKKLYNFLGENYNPDEMTESIKSLKKGNYNKWKVALKPNQIKLFEQCSANTLKRFDYTTTFEESPINPLAKIFFKLHEKIHWAKWMFEMNVIDGIKIKYFGKKPFAE